MLAELTLLAWGERGFRYARARGWDIPTAHDIRQTMILEFLERAGLPMGFTQAYWQAVKHLGPHWWYARREPLPSTMTARAADLDAQLDASMYLHALSPADTALLRHWLEGRQPTDVRRHDHTARRRESARARILTALRIRKDAGWLDNSL